MIEINEIVKKESMNNGRSIFLFYDEFYGLYVAFGLSAFYSTMVVDPFLSYSDTINMPIAFFTKGQIRILRQSLNKVEHTPQCSYEFRTRLPIGEKGYDKWLGELIIKYNSMY